MNEVDVIIPVYKPTPKVFALMDALFHQTLPFHKIILINTEKTYFDELIREMEEGVHPEASRQFEVFREQVEAGNIHIEHIVRSEFDHGGTRNRAVTLSDSPYFVMLTDDALPGDDTLLENLIAPFQGEKVAMSYGRQLPAEGCGILESYTRAFNYPDESRIKSAGDLPVMGIKAFFASNACAAYKKEVFEKLGGFTSHTIFNEDMIYARGVLDAGYEIAYAADACVLHSHNYSGAEQFHRNFDLGVSHALHPEVFSGLATESEGIRLVKKTGKYLLHIKKPWLIVKLVWQSGCKYLGYFLGKRYARLPKALVKSCSMNREYWT